MIFFHYPAQRHRGTELRVRFVNSAPSISHEETRKLVRFLIFALNSVAPWLREMLFFIFVFLNFVFTVNAQEGSFISVISGEKTGEIALPLETYLIPQTIFVGDRGRLVAVLGPAFQNMDAFVLQSPREISVNPDLVISRIELEKRNNGIRLLIDFVPYAPLSFSFPLLQVSSSTGRESLILGGIEINVASILTPELMVLSDPALPLAVPGTGFIVYGGAAVILLILIVAIGVLFWMRRYLGPFREKMKKRRLIASLEKNLNSLRAEDNDFRQKELFSHLAREFREFLCLLTGIDCMVLTPLEFLSLPVLVPGSPGPDYLCGLFRRWDKLRFAGTPMARSSVHEILDELVSFLSIISKGESK